MKIPATYFAALFIAILSLSSTDVQAASFQKTRAEEVREQRIIDKVFARVAKKQAMEASRKNRRQALVKSKNTPAK